MEEQQSKKSKSSGGFQSMGLNKQTLLGVLKKGYRVPTPIQRKAIPAILRGNDIIAMARTGSGKTAAYLVPIINRLETHSTEGVRSLIICPTRELALQTIKVFNELGKLTNLKASLIIGGSKLSDQFDNLSSGPDIIVATPGRLTFILEGANISLNRVEMVCFDEADLMFESGFSEQVSDIMRMLPPTRQILLFSATLPRNLAEFLKNTLKQPEIIRLDTEERLSPDLDNFFYHVKEHEKEGHLLYLLLDLIGDKEQTVVFCATRHEVEYLNEVLKIFDIKTSMMFGKADQQEREINLKKFRKQETHVLLVTDVAARGVDIPELDNVINYDFPATPKLYIHRCGRVARAGRMGKCYNFVQTDEVGYLMDLQVFALENKEIEFGVIPRSFIDPYIYQIQETLKGNYDLEFLKKGSDNSLIMYKKSKPLASGEGISKAKVFSIDQIHPQFKSQDNKDEILKDQWLKGIKDYRPKSTVFEIDSSKLTQQQVMAATRLSHSTRIINAIRRNKEEKEKEEKEQLEKELKESGTIPMEEEQKSAGYIPSVPKKRSLFDDTSDRIIYSTRNPLDFTVEIAADEEADLKAQAKQRVWDRKKKKFVMASGGLDQHRREMKKKMEEKEKVKQQFKEWSKTKEKKENKEKGAKMNTSVKTKEQVLKKKMMKIRHEEQKKAADIRRKKNEKRYGKKK
ncbi:DEAD box ATP-dependent RNA helicase, putative [Entamoeba dispar SAW760]|uniref:DEAD box ATP-dependent RNA helicase, putative n=1 Tax=Entamoeba dispar (strain ATCC PRA-260 / SAW760) TaxID=370354 RepID=B0ECV2_ENTDS|nr:DEAD box ATP-dependent RNA helicase, putative [Entamoeba dispar SAW760]EDR27644.1 DEAD box ATP-dependent RNA helicase, putative [Entamoeba dispar SAW760]|eukprot:EDR27644.1 DEAD box ATP-dependent RNA helicase, putative [Entamoeba dispar SAW760]